MAIVNIPTFEDPFYSTNVALEGTAYTFDFRYNQREDTWYFSISLSDGTELVKGIKVVCRKHLLQRAAEVRLPRGLLLAFSNTSNDAPPGLLELGEDKRVTLTYYTSTETFK